MSDSQEQETLQSSISCIRCEDETSILTSYPTGRNCLRRICSSCSATDRSLNRMAKPPKKGSAEEAKETEEAKKARKAAEALKNSIGKMGSSERAQWYRQEKRKRANESKKSRRTFATAVGSLEETRSTENEDISGMRYITPRDWCAREMVLKLYNTLEDAMAAFNQRCSDPDAITKEINGELCLKVNNGGTESVVDRHSVAASVRQRADLGDGEQLDGFEEEIQPRMKRAKDKLQTERLLSEQQGKQSYVPAVSVRRDLEQEKEVAENRAAEFQQQALALKEKAEQKKKEAKEKQASQLPSMAVARLSLGNAISKANASMSELLKRHKVTFETLSKELAAAVAMADDAVKRESEKKKGRLEETLERLEQEMEQAMGEWLSKAEDESMTVEELVGMEKELAVYMKEWHLGKHCQAVLDTKQEIKNLRDFTSDCKKEMKKRDKLASKATVKSSNKKAKLEHPTQPGAEVHSLVTKLEKHLKRQPMPEDPINCSETPEDVMTVPLLLPCGPTEGFARDVGRHEYYAEQKKWVQQMLQKTSQRYSSAVVTRDNVARTFLQQVEQIIPQSFRPVAKPSTKELQEIWQLYFYQMGEDGGRLTISSDWGLPDLRICCEGKEIYLGFPTRKLSGSTSAELLEHLDKMTAEEFISLVQKDGWAVSCHPGRGVILPPGSVFIQLNLNMQGATTTHGARVHICSEAALQAALPHLDRQVQQEPSLEGKRTGQLLKWIRER